MDQKTVKQLEEVNMLLNEAFKLKSIKFDEFLEFLIKNNLDEKDFLLNRQYLFAYYFLRVSFVNEVDFNLEIQTFCKNVNKLFTKSGSVVINPVILKKLVVIIRPLMKYEMDKEDSGLFSIFKEINKKYGFEI